MCETCDNLKQAVQAWINKQGHNACWFYPEIFGYIAGTLGLSYPDMHMPSEQDFQDGCKRFTKQIYGTSSARHSDEVLAACGEILGLTVNCGQLGIKDQDGWNKVWIIDPETIGMSLAIPLKKALYVSSIIKAAQDGSQTDVSVIVAETTNAVFLECSDILGLNVCSNKTSARDTDNWNEVWVISHSTIGFRVTVPRHVAIELCQSIKAVGE